jgi:hypothetical protein
MFFSQVFPFRVMLDLFDQRDGLRRLYNTVTLTFSFSYKLLFLYCPIYGHPKPLKFLQAAYMGVVFAPAYGHSPGRMLSLGVCVHELVLFL